MPSSDKEKALRLLKRYRERLTGIGDVHYLEEVAFLIHTFESPVFEKLLRNMGGTVHTSASKVVPASVYHNGKVASSTSVHNGVHHVVHTERDDNSVLLSDNASTSFSMATTTQTATKQLSGRSIQPIANGMPKAGVTNSSHTVTAPSYNFYLTSSSGSQLSNTDSWGSIDLPMGDERRLPDFDGYHLHSSGGTANGLLKKLPVSNSPAALSPLSQVPSSNKSSSSSVSVKSVVTVSDSNKGPPSDTALVRSSSSQEGPVKATAKKKEQHITVSLHKGKEGLGFSVVGLATEHKGDLGIYIQDIQKGGLAEKSGKLFKGDQIVSINGRALAGVSHSSAIKMLQKAKGQVELKLIRSSSVGPPADVQPISMVMDDKDQYKWRQIETIELSKEGKGFGFGIVSVKKGGVDICKIADGSAAAKDGRLKVNDHLLQINNQNTTKMSADDVMKILKGAKSSVKLVVARMVTGQVQPTKGLVVNEPDADLEQFTVELEKERNGLGITIAGLKKEDTEEELRGIYVSSVASDGPASREGRIREGDQILQVNDTSLIGLENMAAAGVLRNTDQRVRLIIGRRRHQQSPDLTSSTSSGNHHGNIEASNKVKAASGDVSNDNMFFSDDSIYAKPLTAAEDLKIKKEWSEVVGKEYTIVIAQFAKSIPDTGLGIRVEGRVDLDDNQQPIEGGHHHIIELVREEGPVYKHSALKQGDEILEVNGISMINLEYNAAIQVIKATPHHVRIVAARNKKSRSSPLESPNSELLRDIIFPVSQSLKSSGETNSMEGAHTSESEDDKRMHTPEKTNSSILSATLSTSASDDNRWKSELARRRAERDSWRKRHEEEKERLRIRIEKNRQDIQRQLKEKEAEFNRMQEELEREQRSLKELQQEKLAAGDYTGVDVPLSYKSYMEEFGSSPTWDHVLYNHRKQLQGATTRNTSSPVEDIKVSDSELGFDSDTSDSDVSSQDLPSPIPPSTRWCQVTTDITLYKGSRGLGFSILDFMDKDENSVILICSIVSGGVADRNGHLKVGDKLIAINHQDVVGKPLADVVNMLMMIERGTVIITVSHKLVADEEERAFFGSMGGGSGEFPSIREENSPEVLPSVNTPMNDSVDEIIAKPLMADNASDGGNKHSTTMAAGVNIRPSLQSSSTPHLNDTHKAHKRLVDLRETVNVTSTSSLYTPLSHTSGMAMDEQLRRSMPDLLDKLPSNHSKRYTDFKKVNTLPYKKNKNKIISPTPSSFMPLNLGTQRSQRSPSPVRNSLSQSMNSAFSRVTPDKLSNSDSDVYHMGREALNRNEEVPVLDTGGDLLVQQVRPAITMATIDMATTNGPKDTVAANNYQQNNIQTTPVKQPSDRRHILQPLHQPIISQPRTITIARGNTGLGMSLACDAETDSIVVKSILSGSAVGRDGRIRIGDCIIAINHESLEGVSLSQAKAILRASSLNPAGVLITYIPCPQGYVPTIATNHYVSNESSSPSSPEHLGYGDHMIEQPGGRQEFMMSDQQPVRDISHDLHKIPAASRDPMMLPGYPSIPGSADVPRSLQQNRMSYQSLGMVEHKYLTSHPYSDSKVSYHPANPYSSYQVVPPQPVYSVPNTPRAEKFQPPPSYEVHMMTRQISHGERQQQKPVTQQSQQRQQLFTPASVPATASVTPVNYHMVDQPHPQQQQQMYLSAAPPSYHRSSPVRMMSEQSRVQQQFHPPSYAVDTHPIRLSEAQQQTPLPAYPMEPHPSLGEQQQQQLYYIGAQGYSSEAHPSSMHYSQQQQLGKSPAHHNDAATALLQSGGSNPAPPPVSSAAYQIPTTSHMAAGPPDSFSHSSQQKAPPPSYESYVRTSVHRQSRSQSPITTASMIPHQHSASDNSLGKTSTSSLFQNVSMSHQRDPATGVVSDAGRSPMVVRGHSAQGQYSPLLNKTDSKSRSGGDLHMRASDGSGSKVLRNTSSGALRRYSGSGYLNKPPQYQPSSKHPSAASDISREDGGGPSVHEVELTKDMNGSLGISILGTPEGDRKRDEPVGGVFVNTITPQVTGKLKSGDKILEVNGKSLLQCTQQEAIEILCAAANPVKLLVQSCYSHIRMRNQGSQQRKGSSSRGGSSPSPIPAGRRAAIHSWYIEEEEDPQLRKCFPNAEGHLFEVTLHRDGKKSLGMNLVPNEHSMSKGIIITVVQPGGVADSTGKVKPGDVILQVDDVLVMDLKQEEVVALLKRPNPSIHLVLMRPMAHLMGLHLQIPRGAHTNAEQSGQGALSPSPFDQTDADDSSLIHPDVTALTATKIINLTKDNVHGLGFSVMEEKINKRLVVMVKDVVVGGPAYREGQLQIGDILLSIDGKSVVGESYNTTLHLLKQAKGKGSATLVFAPGSLNGMSPGESPTKESSSSPVISPLPLVTKPSPTRDGGKQPEASAEQGSSSRKSSTSELAYDTRVVRSTRKKSSKERKVKKRPDSYRQSSVDELEENMQKLQQQNKLEQLVPEKDEPSMTYEEFEVEVAKGSGPLGLKVVGGADTNLKDVVIKEIVPNTQADIDGQLRPGDHILQVNGEDLKYSTHLQAMQAIWNSGPRVKLCVRRKLSATNDGNFSFSESLHSPCMEVEVIELVKPEQAGLGLIIGSREDRDGVFVDEVVVNGVANNDGRIRSGDKILAINGQDVSATKQDLVAIQLQGCKGKISLTVGHAVGMSPVKDRSPDIGKYPLSIGPPVEVHHSQQSPPSYPDYNNNSDSIDPNRTSSSSLQATSSSVNNYTDSYPPSYHSSSPPIRLSPQVPHISHDPPPYPSGTNMQHHMSSGDPHPYPSQESTHKEITLCRGPSGLGFTFLGGNDIPFYIKDIAKDGVADKDGRLQRGDQLIAVNGISIQGASYQYVLETLKKFHGDINLTVIPS